MTSFRLPVLACLLLAVGCSLPANAGKKKALPPPPVDSRILVTAVDMANKKITVVFKRSKQTTTYIVDDFTQVTFENSPGSIKDIKVGQQIFSYVERDGNTLDSLTVGAAEPAPVAIKGK